MTETNKVEINIQGTIFPLRVSKEELKWVKKIEKSINSKIQEISNSHTNIKFTDCLSLALISSEFENQAKEQQIQELQGSLENIDSELSNF